MRHIADLPNPIYQFPKLSYGYVYDTNSQGNFRMNLQNRPLPSERSKMPPVSGNVSHLVSSEDNSSKQMKKVIRTEKERIPRDLVKSLTSHVDLLMYKPTATEKKGLRAIGETICDLRRSMNLSRREFAEQIGIVYGLLIIVENGQGKLEVSKQVLERVKRLVTQTEDCGNQKVTRILKTETVQKQNLDS